MTPTVNPRMRVGALLFDLDGTLADSHHEICLALDKAMIDLGIGRAFAEVERLVDGSPLEVIWEKVTEQAPTSPDYARFVGAYRSHYMRDLGFKTRLFPGVVGTLERLRERSPALPLCVVSNKSEKSVGPLLARLGVDHHFSVALGAGGTDLPPKPHPALLLHAARAVGCAPHTCVMIGDTTLDVQAGKSAAMRTIALAYGMGLRDDLHAAGADHVIDDFSTIESLLAE